MKTILLTATYLVGIGELFLAIFFWATHSKSEIRKVMALLALSTGMWVVLSAFTAYKGDEGAVAIANKIIFVSGITLITALLHLVVIFPYPLFRLDRYHKLLAYVPVIIFSSLAISSDALQVGATGDLSHPGKIIQGPAYSTYNSYLMALYLLTVFILFKRSKKLDGIHKKNNQILLIGVLFGGLPAVYVDLVAPLYLTNYEFNYVVGVLFTGFWLGATMRIITRR